MSSAGAITKQASSAAAIPSARRLPLACSLLFATSCAGIPVAKTADPEWCIHDAKAWPSHIAPHKKRVGVCFGEDHDCLVLDHVAGKVVDRAEWPDGGEGAFPASLRVERPDERFRIEATDEITKICDGDHNCRTMHLPVEDQQTVMPILNTDGTELYFISREATGVFLDALAISPTANRLAHIRIGNNVLEHTYSVDARVGTALVVHEVITGDLGAADVSNVLVDPVTGKQRVLLDGTAAELDTRTALVVEDQRVSIVDTHGLVTLASRDGAGIADANGSVAAVAYTNPPRVVMIEKHAFTRTWRLPVCH
jgi:hypothetical protein